MDGYIRSSFSLISIVPQKPSSNTYIFGKMVFAIALATILVILISRWVYKWRNPSCNGVLPPGSMGLPIIGESIAYFTPYFKDDVPLFIRKRVSKYAFLFIVLNSILCNIY